MLLKNLQQIVTSVCIDGRWTTIVDDEQLNAAEATQDSCITSVAAR
jgi:hypothetical protein